MVSIKCVYNEICIMYIRFQFFFAFPNMFYTHLTIASIEQRHYHGIVFIILECSSFFKNDINEYG